MVHAIIAPIPSPSILDKSLLLDGRGVVRQIRVMAFKSFKALQAYDMSRHLLSALVTGMMVDSQIEGWRN